MKKLSFIIPVYNGEKYIDRCINSICAMNNVEIIIVNDSSTDSSLKILEDYSKKYSNITLLTNEKNLGVSATRNRALSIASAKYIMFLDIDDYLPADAIDTLDDLCDLDYDYINFGVISKKQNSLIHNPLPHIGQMSTQTLLSEKIKTFLDVNVSTWIKNKLYRRDIINNYNIEFDKDMSFSEDMKFNLNFIIHTNNLYFSDKYLIIYDRDIPNSLSKQHESKNISEYFKQRKFLSKFFLDNNIPISDEYYLDCVGLLTYDVFKVLNSNSNLTNKLSELDLLFSNDISYLLPYFNIEDRQELALRNAIQYKDKKYLTEYKE